MKKFILSLTSTALLASLGHSVEVDHHNEPKADGKAKVEKPQKNAAKINVKARRKALQPVLERLIAEKKINKQEASRIMRIAFGKPAGTTTPDGVMKKTEAPAKAKQGIAAKMDKAEAKGKEAKADKAPKKGKENKKDEEARRRCCDRRWRNATWLDEQIKVTSRTKAGAKKDLS